MNHFLTSKKNVVITLLFEWLGDRDWRHIGELVEAVAERAIGIFEDFLMFISVTTQRATLSVDRRRPFPD